MATETAHIEIPTDLRPRDGRFGSGPSKVRPEALAALADTGTQLMGTSHRQPPVKSLVGRLRQGLSELFALPDGYDVVLGVGGATLFWDAATFSLIERRSQRLAFGEFSSKFVAAVAAAPHLEAPEVIESRAGTHPEPRANPDVDCYALTHNETSTGVCMEVRRPERSRGVVLVDATSAAGAIPIDPTQFDAYYFSPQKVFAADGGLWTALLSPAGVERVERLADRHRPASLDLALAIDNSRKDQTYNTPALATMFLFAEQVAWINEQGGMEWSAARCRRSSEILYGWAEASTYATPFVAKPDER